MATASDATFEAVMKEIKACAVRVGSENTTEANKAATLRDLAAAYRHLRGGAQPGGTVVEK